MKTKKKVLYTTSLFLSTLLVVAMLSFFSGLSQSDQAEDIYGRLPPVVERHQLPDTDAFMLYSFSGQHVAASSLVESRYAQDLTNDGLHVITTDPSQYDIFYNASTMSGFITLYNEHSLQTARALAERTLSRILWVPHSTLCDLNVSVYTNQFVNPAFSGLNLGFTDCPGSIVLP